MKYLSAILFAACVLLATPTVRAEDQRIAIVVNAESGIQAISAKEVRRAYLGASIVLNGVEIRPLLNQSDPLAVEVFLQRIMFMSAEAYNRQLISHAFQGGSRPKDYENPEALIAALHRDNAAITFMMYDTAVRTRGIRIIGKL